MNRVEITICPPHETTRALQVLFASLPSAERQSMVASLRDSLESNPTHRRGLLIASGQGGICGAVFAQEYPGRTAVVWPPSTTSGEADVQRRLAMEADAHLAVRGVVMAQSLLASQEDPVVAALEHVGFAHLTQLDYMIAQTQSAHPVLPSDELPSDELQFQPYRADHHARMAALVEATYAQTDDCPELNGVRDPDDVLVGYQSTGAFDPARWFIVSHAGSEVGVLLLTEHPPARQWELVYMALVPHARRQGFGKKIVQFALERARAAGIETLLLAVDARNKPGCRLYEACGFRVWDRRAVYWKQYGADASRRDTFSTCQKE